VKAHGGAASREKKTAVWRLTYRAQRRNYRFGAVVAETGGTLFLTHAFQSRQGDTM